MTAIGRGLVAGAFGTLLLNAATYLDMALTGREASTAPGETVKRAGGTLGLSVPAVKSRLLRARLQLRERLSRYFRKNEDGTK